MITFILLFFFLILAITFATVAYSANGRERAGQSEVPSRGANRQTQNRTAGQN